MNGFIKHSEFKFAGKKVPAKISTAKRSSFLWGIHMSFIVEANTRIKTKQLNVVLKDFKARLALNAVCRKQKGERFAELTGTFENGIFFGERRVGNHNVPVSGLTGEEVLAGSQRTVHHVVTVCPEGLNVSRPEFIERAPDSNAGISRRKKFKQRFHCVIGGKTFITGGSFICGKITDVLWHMRSTPFFDCFVKTCNNRVK
nr:MAG TPA: hypothetical protein [Siphoviridae sp. ctX8T1]